MQNARRPMADGHTQVFVQIHYIVPAEEFPQIISGEEKKKNKKQQRLERQQSPENGVQFGRFHRSPKSLRV